MQVQYPGALGVSAADIEKTFFVEQRSKSFGRLSYCPRHKQIVVTGVDAAVGPERLIDRTQVGAG
ncbi:hypothetical protein D3C78_1953420 [compost metagenome]